MRFARNSGLTKSDDGLFGLIKRFIGAVETKENGTLHLHVIFRCRNSSNIYKIWKHGHETAELD